MPDFHVAIIGAGLSGLSLALALDEQRIPCTLYEAQDAPLNTGGGVMLTPNGLKVLQALGIYDSLLETSYSFGNSYVQHGPSGNIVETLQHGSVAKYGLNAMRAYRYDVLEQLLARVKSKGFLIHFNRRFSQILSEDNESVTWQFTDGSTANASILVGADGIHSSVRPYIAPEIKLSYGGVVFLVAAVPTSQLALPASELSNLNDAGNTHPLPSGIVVPQLGAFIIAPQTKSGDEVMITVMRHLPEEPESWGAIDKDKDGLRSMFRENADQFPEVVRNALKDIPDESLRIWPSYNVPRMEKWTSSAGRVVVLGDSAHAVPPSAGQGVNMAFEDVLLFAGVLGRLDGDFSHEKLQMVLHGWQLFRQKRLDCVLRLNSLMEQIRLPGAAKESLKGSVNEEFDELFKINYEQAVDECMRIA